MAVEVHNGERLLTDLQEDDLDTYPLLQFVEPAFLLPHHIIFDACVCVCVFVCVFNMFLAKTACKHACHAWRTLHIRTCGPSQEGSCVHPQDPRIGRRCSTVELFDKLPKICILKLELILPKNSQHIVFIISQYMKYILLLYIKRPKLCPKLDTYR
jgi:hypothetical protein